MPVDRRPYALAVAPDQRTVWIPSHDDATIDVLDTASLTITRRIDVAPNPHWVEFSRDGTRAYTANHESNVVSVLDTATSAVVAEIPVGRSPHSVAVHPTRPLVDGEADQRGVRAGRIAGARDDALG